MVRLRAVGDSRSDLQCGLNRSVPGRQKGLDRTANPALHRVEIRHVGDDGDSEALGGNRGGE
jgi:hypothetical protein